MRRSAQERTWPSKIVDLLNRDYVCDKAAAVDFCSVGAKRLGVVAQSAVGSPGPRRPFGARVGSPVFLDRPRRRPRPRPGLLCDYAARARGNVATLALFPGLAGRDHVGLADPQEPMAKVGIEVSVEAISRLKPP